MTWRTLGLTGLVGLGLTVSAGVAEAKPNRKGPRTIAPVQMVEAGDAIPVAGGHVEVGPDGTARCRIAGFGTDRGFRYAFEIEGKLILAADGRTVRKGKLAGKAYWIHRTPRGRRVKFEKIRGTITGTLDATTGSTLQWQIDRRGPAWGGEIRIGTPSEVSALEADSVASFVHVDGNGGNDAGAAYGFEAETERRRAKVNESGAVGLRRMQAVRSWDLGETGAYHGVFRTTWRADGETQASLGVVTIGARGRVAALAPETRVLHEDGNTSLTRDGDNLEIRVASGAPPSLRVGDVVVSAMGDGQLGRVRGIAPVDDRTVIALLDPVPMSEAVQEGVLSFDAADAADSPSKVNVGGGLDARLSVSRTPEFSAGPLDVALPMSAELRAALEMSGKFSRSGVDEFELRGTASISARVGVEVDAGGTASIDEVYPLLDSGPKAFYGHVGILPVVGSTRWKLRLHVEGEMHATASYRTAVEIEEQLELGFRYDRSSGWTTTSDHTHTTSYDAPTWTYEYPEGRLRVRLVPVLEVKLYGSVGASLEPYLFGEFAADMDEASDGAVTLDWELAAGFGLDATISAGLFDRTFFEQTWNVVPDQDLLFKTGSVLVRAAPPVDPPADPGEGDSGDDSGGDSGNGSGGNDGGGGTVDVVVPRVSTAGVNVDGVIGASEWADAWSSTETFPNRDGGNSITCTLKMKHDGQFLYVGMSTPLANGWDSKGRLRIDGDDSGAIDGETVGTYFDIQSERGAPSAWSGYTNYMALTGAPAPFATHVSPGSGYATASAGSANVAYEFKIPLSDLGAQAGSMIRLIATASPNGTTMWHWPAADLSNAGPANPGVWSRLRLAQ